MVFDRLIQRVDGRIGDFAADSSVYRGLCVLEPERVALSLRFARFRASARLNGLSNLLYNQNRFHKLWNRSSFNETASDRKLIERVRDG